MNKPACDRCRKRFIVVQQVGSRILKNNIPYLCEGCYIAWLKFYNQECKRHGVVGEEQWTKTFLSWFNKDSKEVVVFT